MTRLMDRADDLSFIPGWLSKSGNVPKYQLFGDIAEDSPSNTINTAFVERTNLDWRLWDAHLVRKSITFAKSVRWLKAKFAICVAFYDFIRPHETLSRGKDRKFRPRTPAMAAGITNHQWTPREILSYKVLCQ